MNKYLYLFIDLSSVLVPLLFSFHPKGHFAGRWRAWVPAIIFPALIFIAWDTWFAGMGVWGFNSSYITGISVGNLPLEEILFFFCIPYACLFTYAAVNYLRKTDPLPDQGKKITWILFVGLLATGIKNYNLWYTSVTFIALAVFLFGLIMFVKPNYLGRFYFSFLFILVPFFIVNGVLTGTFIHEPVVWYDNAENLGIRMGTIPFEDIFYGMLLILMNVGIYEFLLSRGQPVMKSVG